MDATASAQALLVTALVVVEVGLWQLRVTLATRGRRHAAALLGGLDAALYVVLLGRVVTDLDQPLSILGYAAGVAAGVFLGCLVQDRTASEPLEYRLVSPGDGTDLLDELRSRGWPVTALPAAGLTGEAAVLFVAVPARAAARVEADLRAVAPGAFWTSSRLRSATTMP